MRLFVAGYPPPGALDHLAEAVGRMRLGQAAAGGGSVGLTARPLWHLTLAFLGEVAEPRVPTAAAAVDSAVTGRRGDGATPPRLRLAGGGRFGRGRFTVLWVGVDGDLDGLRTLAAGVRRALAAAGLPYDGRRPFRPHVTVARPGSRLPAADLDADLATLASYVGPWWSLDAVHLVRSHPGPRPVHDPLVTVPVTGGR